MSFLLAALLVAGGGSTAAYAALEEEPAAAGASAYQETRLLFGTARPGGGEAVTDAEFRSFLGDFVTPRFPDGLTVQEGYGQWRDEHGVIERERSYELVLYYPAGDGGESDREIEEIRAEYLKRFGQESVARVDDRVRVAF
ncbi:DUF3574 domain-containing protein [Streptomyces litchfieldiae]|uniref:DUF3574 domain-containing protein n=1 Tax=Streptomyces litchfieldiae TaxID=3075543 RepID=A0ABU2MTL0_9ACTN|nr:DUF3574 domain-containing protein [Streptomyces sp. DSM 44938]MDT0344975.1 DUF3574 domain-containing protein [Streptomyces sp. DSM 44938]